MTNSELGACRRMLHQINNQLTDGRTPEDTLISAARYCDRLDLADKLLPVLILAWLGGGLQQGRDLLQMVADAEHLTQIFTEEATP